MGNFIRGRIRCLKLSDRSQPVGLPLDDCDLLLSVYSMSTSRSQPSWPAHFVAMNLARVLFKKQHAEQQPQHSEHHHDDGRSLNVHRSPAHSPATGVQVPSDETAETSPTTRSPRRKTRSTTAKHSAVKSSSDVLPNPLHSTVVFKAIRSSSHRRFAQVLPNLFLGTLHSFFFTLSSHIYYTPCLKKTSPMFLAITRESIIGFS